MAVKDSKTEQQIKDAAKRLFFAEGKFNATTQEIADAAGVNRTLVNYYFRSRDILFSLILKDARAAMDKRMETFLAKATNLRSKLSHVIDVYMEQALEYPYIETYMITRMHENLEAAAEGFTKSNHAARIKLLMLEIESEMEKGNIKQMSPQQFFINFIALMSGPVTFSTMYKKILNVSDKQYKLLIQDRKEIILTMLFSK
ncbi:TetR/AcrR family transcriptional regulator [Flavitalea antarctica]